MAEELLDVEMDEAFVDKMQVRIGVHLGLRIGGGMEHSSLQESARLLHEAGVDLPPAELPFQKTRGGDGHPLTTTGTVREGKRRSS